MGKKNKQREEVIQNQHNDYTKPEEFKILKKKTIKELIAPSGVDTSNIDHLEIISNDGYYKITNGQISGETLKNKFDGTIVSICLSTDNSTYYYLKGEK